MSVSIAQPNIALIKYWGKRDEALIIPATSSISLTLDGFPTTTSVTVDEHGVRDEVTLNGAPLSAAQTTRIIGVLDHVRTLAGTPLFARVDTHNTIPTAAGLASSAAGFAALAHAATHAYGVGLSDRELSRVARLGSGSASRSVFGGMVRWNRGFDHESSYAEPLEWAGPPLAFVIAQISAAEKAVSSRAGMLRTIETSPFYPGWVETNQQLVAEAEAAVAVGDLEQLGALTETSTLRMHASMLGARPPLRYLTGASFSVFDTVAALRAEGVPVWATADAGPNVKLLTPQSEQHNVVEHLRTLHPDLTLLTAGIGQGVHHPSE